MQVSKSQSSSQTLNRTLKSNEVQKEFGLKVYNTLTVSMITCRQVVLALKKFNKRRIAAAKMKFMRRTIGVTLRNMVRSETITLEL